jgi:hypothetical protein
MRDCAVAPVLALGYRVATKAGSLTRSWNVATRAKRCHSRTNAFGLKIVNSPLLMICMAITDPPS